MLRKRSVLSLLAFYLMIFVNVDAAVAEPGVKDNELIIGAYTSETGPFADKGFAALGYYFDDLNEKGGVEGRKIKYIREDVGLVVSRAVEVAKKLVEQDQIFAMVNAGPSPAHQATWRYLVEKGVPDFWFNDALRIYQEPFQKTVFPALGPFYGDGVSLAEYVIKKPEFKKACFLIINGEVGNEMVAGAKETLERFNKDVKAGAGRSVIEIGPIEKVDRTAPNCNSEVLKLKRANCDAVFTLLFGPNFPGAINFGFDQGFKPMWLSYSFNSKKAIFDLMKEGIRDRVAATQYSVRQATGTDDPVWKRVEDFAKKHNMTDSITAVPFALAAGDVFSEAVKRAGKDLTRAKFISALESMNGYKCDTCLQTLNFSSSNHWPFKPPQVSVLRNGKFEKAQ